MTFEIFGACALVLIYVAWNYYDNKSDKKKLASIPEEFKYLYIYGAGTDDFIAIDMRNKKMLLSLYGIGKTYDFADIQGHEKDKISARKTKLGGKFVWEYDLVLHVNDPQKPMWKFRGNRDETYCVELLVSRALDGTLPDTDERKTFKTRNVKDCESFLSTGTGAQG